MRQRHQRDTGERPVTVGVDGTDSSVPALRWAAGEARVRGRPLRIVYAAPHLTAPTGADLHAYATSVLVRARDRVRSTDASLEVQSVLARTDPVPALLDASVDSDLLVVGSADDAGAGTGVGDELRVRARCPVVIVAAADGSPAGRRRGALRSGHRPRRSTSGRPSRA